MILTNPPEKLESYMYLYIQFWSDTLSSNFILARSYKLQVNNKRSEQLKICA